MWPNSNSSSVSRPEATHPLELSTSKGGRSLDHEKPGTTVTVRGYLTRYKRLKKNLHLWTLRSRDYLNAVPIIAEKLDDARIRQVAKSDTPVFVTGTREICMVKDSRSATEIHAKDIVPLSSIDPDNGWAGLDHEYPQNQRHLQLRYSSHLKASLKTRARIYFFCRRILSRDTPYGEYLEIETPILFKSTPEGAREFIVPTRRKGFAYALPQSPQQFKQALMASGIDAYFQFARCFRDEDLRADRQPEFTQLDMEKSFADGIEIMRDTEAVIQSIWKELLYIELPSVFPRMTFHEAIEGYGSDKPDLRFSDRHIRIDHKTPADFISKISPLTQPLVEVMVLRSSKCMPPSTKEVRAALVEFLDSPEALEFHRNPHGGPAVIVFDSSKALSGLSPLGFEAAEEIETLLSPNDGDILTFQARPDAPFVEGATSLGRFRSALQGFALRKGLIIPEKTWAPLWVIDFPLFTPTSEESPGQGGKAGLSSTHHPFTSPKTATDVDLLRTDPSKAIADHYDLVINGVELGGGSRRIHDPALQTYVLKDVLKMNVEKIANFDHLIDMLASGCPPHAGIALGMDRLVAMVVGRDSVRDVIAFPKTGKGDDLTMGSPGKLDDGTLKTYHLQFDKGRASTTKLPLREKPLEAQNSGKVSNPSFRRLRVQEDPTYTTERPQREGSLKALNPVAASLPNDNGSHGLESSHTHSAEHRRLRKKADEVMLRVKKLNSQAGDLFRTDGPRPSSQAELSHHEQRWLRNWYVLKCIYTEQMRYLAAGGEENPLLHDQMRRYAASRKESLNAIEAAYPDVRAKGKAYHCKYGFPGYDFWEDGREKAGFNENQSPNGAIPSADGQSNAVFPSFKSLVISSQQS